MTNKKFKFLNIFLLSALMFITVDIVFANDKKQASSTWVWQAKSPTRTIYLLGEMHYFYILNNDININHRLAERIYELSDEIYIENMQEGAVDYNLHTYLSEHLKDKMHDVVAKIINKISRQSETDKTKLINEYYLKFSESDPLFVYNELLNINALKHIANNNGLHTLAEGFLITLRGKKKSILHKFSSKKIVEIESKNSLVTAWRQFCNTNKNAEILINSALDTIINEKNYAENLSIRTQNVFINPNSTIEDIMNEFSKMVEGEIIIKCASDPRNHIWINTIKDKIKEPGLPIAIVAGVAHMGGENGLIELLKKEGFNDIKRIYDIK